MLAVYKFFSDNKTNGYKLTDFRAEWAQLADKDKEDLKTGVLDGSFNY